MSRLKQLGSWMLRSRVPRLAVPVVLTVGAGVAAYKNADMFRLRPVHEMADEIIDENRRRGYKLRSNFPYDEDGDELVWDYMEGQRYNFDKGVWEPVD